MDIFDHFFGVTRELFNKGYHMPRKLIESQVDNRFYWHLEGKFSKMGMEILQTGYDIEECLYRDFHETYV